MSHCLKQNKQGRWVVYAVVDPMHPVFTFEKDMVVAAVAVTNFLNGGSNITQEKLTNFLRMAVWYQE